ncbi:MAG: FKBP-type peptidyl-prolyl cis-trans isomerase [Patescibacteria group bacterium]|jgi:FKBP-type peptidyl-prolyl cis-trans isomerase
MKSLLYLIPVLCLTIACGSGGPSVGGGSTALTTFEDSLCYSFGSLTADDLKTRGVSLEPAAFGAGVEKELDGSSTMTEEEMFGTFAAFSKELQTAGGAFTEVTPTTINIDSLSYAIGKNLGAQLKTGEVKVNVAATINGLNDVYASTLKIDKVTAEKIMKTYTVQARQKEMDANAAKLKPNIEEGEAFLKENGTKEGVKTTESGLQYKVLTAGKGAKPAPTDRVLVHYEGRLLNGEVFDSSIERGEPIEFGLNQVIKGWTEGVSLMSPGAKYQLYIPYNLAYGMQGSPPKIGGGATLIFDVELLEVK